MALKPFQNGGMNVFNMIVDMKNVLQHNSDLINNYNVENSLIKKIFNEY